MQSTLLFKGINSAEFESVLTCIGAEAKSVKKGKIIFFAGDKLKFTGVVVSGQLHIIREDFNGNRSLLASVTPGELFAEALCCAGVTESPVTVVAAMDSVYFMLKISRLLQSCANACSFHRKLIENMLTIIAKKTLMLQSRMEIIELKSIRAKVLRYLESFVKQQGINIKIPYNRDEMADFLCVERSALSHELMKMRKDGLIEYRKNGFILK